MHSQQIQQTSNRSFHILVGWAVLGFCILAWGCMTYINRHILTPVKHITEVVNSRANHDEQAFCKLNRSDEIGELGQALNQMLIALDSSQEELKTSFEELEKRRIHSELQAKELEERNRELQIAQQQAAAASMAKSEFFGQYEP